MVERARRSVGGTIAAARAALKMAWRRISRAGRIIRSAIAVKATACSTTSPWPSRVLMRDGAIARALVVDLDVHQGNGTAAIFHDEPAVFTFSMHGANNFPFRKETSDLDVALPDGVGDDEYLALLAQHLPSIVEAHRPDLVFYVAGADPYEGDRLGRLKLTMDGLRARDALVFDTCRAAGLPVALSMAGGYAADVEATVAIHASTIREAARHAQPRAATAAL